MKFKKCSLKILQILFGTIEKKSNKTSVIYIT